eukprot:6490970-Amphidinium_carterae.3
MLAGKPQTAQPEEAPGKRTHNQGHCERDSPQAANGTISEGRGRARTTKGTAFRGDMQAETKDKEEPIRAHARGRKQADGKAK